MGNFVIRVLVGATLLNSGCVANDPCIAERQLTIESPSGYRKITVFPGPCPGAAPQVLVEFARDGGGGGGVFAVEDSVVDVRARWVGEDTVEIAFPSTARVVKRDSVIQFRAERVFIRYAPFAALAH
jgi:hypothetical protein